MPRSAKVQRILFETDAPELLVAHDSVGATHLVMRVERGEAQDLFLCTPISPRRLAEVCGGRIDVRGAFERSETGDVFTAEFSADDTLDLKATPKVLKRWLPDAGFPLTEFLSAEYEDTIVEKTNARVTQIGAFAGSFKLNPPEAALEPRIEFYHLATGLRLFQDLIRCCGEKAWQKLKEETKRLLGGVEPFDLHALADFAGGSFEVHFESKSGSTVDGIGQSAVGIAMQTVDEITRYVDDPNTALPALRKNSGHAIRAYQSMLRFVVTENTPISYVWGEPGARATKHHISVDAAQRTYEVLTQTNNLTGVEVIHVGQFVNLGAKAVGGVWRLKPEGKKKLIRGESLAADLLDDVKFRKTTYKLVCEERLEESVVSGKIKKVYYLKEKPLPLTAQSHT